MEILQALEQTVDPALPLIDQVSFPRALMGFVLVFFIPGFAWTLILFRRVALIERFVLSFGLSIALVTLSVCALLDALQVTNGPRRKLGSIGFVRIKMHFELVLGVYTNDNVPKNELAILPFHTNAYNIMIAQSKS